jgi:hypothetical protein
MKRNGLLAIRIRSIGDAKVASVTPEFADVLQGREFSFGHAGRAGVVIRCIALLAGVRDKYQSPAWYPVRFMIDLLTNLLTKLAVFFVQRMVGEVEVVREGLERGCEILRGEKIRLQSIYEAQKVGALNPFSVTHRDFDCGSEIERAFKGVEQAGDIGKVKVHKGLLGRFRCIAIPKIHPKGGRDE